MIKLVRPFWVAHFEQIGGSLSRRFFTDLSGITKLLTFHIARHTFATTVTLNNGVPIESVAKMMGHPVLKQRKSMRRLWTIK